MQYIIFIDGEDYEQTMLAAATPPTITEYLDRAIATLRPLSPEEYMNGPAVVLGTLAKYSYVLHGQDVLWCIEWQPGMLVVRCSPNGHLAWTALRSPVPDFGGREASEAELDAYDEDEENPQYNIIFDPWDAQFEELDRESAGFAPGDPETQETFEAALAPVNDLHETLQKRYGDDREEWANRCIQNLAAWSGEGIRLA